MNGRGDFRQQHFNKLSENGKEMERKIMSLTEWKKWQPENLWRGLLQRRSEHFRPVPREAWLLQAELLWYEVRI